MPSESAPSAMKEWFNAARYAAIADDLGAVAPGFDRKRFLHLALDGLGERELMARLHQTSVAAHAALPGDYREQLEALRRFAPRVKHGFVGVFLPDFVATYGLDDFEASLEALKFFTSFGSSEFGIRPFIDAAPARTLAVMETWAHDPGEHVRRLASEGCRPRLPWGRRLPTLIHDPEPLRPILEALKDDPALYVRKSVANNLNDIAKDHPEWALDLLESWDLTAPGTAWIAKRAARTLIKRGHPRTLKLFGIGAAPRLEARLTLAPRKLALGGVLQINIALTSTAPRRQKLAVDYVIHYVKARGTTSAKVFKWTELDLAPGSTVALAKRQTIRDFTTRRHHAGKHRVDLQINGRIMATDAFTLTR